MQRISSTISKRHSRRDAATDRPPPPGSRHRRVVSARDRGRACALRLRADDERRPPQGRARRARPRPHRGQAPAALPHPPRPRGCSRCARARAPVAPGPCLRGRRAAPDRPDKARIKRPPSLRHGIRRALGRARADPGTERARCRRQAFLGSSCFPTPGHAWHHVSYLDSDGTLYAGDAAGVRHRLWTLRVRAVPAAGVRPRGVGADDHRDRGSRAGPSRAHPLRGLRRRPGSPRGAPRDARALVVTRRGRHGRSDVRRRRPLRRRAGRCRARGRLRSRGAVLAPLPRHRALLAEEARGRRRHSRTDSSSACASSSASETNSSADACVASSTTGGATPASSASTQRAATTHQRSPGQRPGNIHCG